VEPIKESEKQTGSLLVLEGQELAKGQDKVKKEPLDEAQERQKRRLLFARVALLTLAAQRVHEVIMKSIKEKFPTIEPSILPTILIHVIGSGSGNQDTEAALNLENIESVKKIFPTIGPSTLPMLLRLVLGYQNICGGALDSSGNTKTGILSAYFRPPSTDEYAFRCSSNDALMVNGVKLPLQDDPEGGFISSGVMMSIGKDYLLTCSLDMHNISWSTKHSIALPFTSTTLIPKAHVIGVHSVLQQLYRIATIVSKLALSMEEFTYFTSTRGEMRFDFNNMTLMDLEALERYRWMRDSEAWAKDRHSLIHFFEWLGHGKAKEPSGGSRREQKGKSKTDKKQEDMDISGRIAAMTTWPEAQVRGVLDLKYPGMQSTTIVRLLHAHDLKEIASLQRIMELFSTVNATPGVKVSMETLFRLATPGSVDYDFENAQALQHAVTEAQRTQSDMKLQESQRNALVEYILQQSYFKNKGIYDADGLFDYFLIDVQMGSQLKITRMKEAISTVQLYVQRCLLGLERDEEDSVVKISDTDRTKWLWMRKHNTWQAMRKAFLYPENWLDPSLRDNKTDLFADYESSMMQKHLSWDTFMQAIRKYVHDLSKIAHLDIQAYLRQLGGDNSGIYHFFARTRSAPYEFYYREMNIHTESHAPWSKWSQWSRIEVDIMPYDTEWDGTTIPHSGNYLIPLIRDDRLFLYIPQIMAQKVVTKKGKGSNKKLQEITDDDIKDAMTPKNWEIRIAWTERIDSAWTPNRVSQVRLLVEWKNNGLPSVANFIFQASI